MHSYEHFQYLTYGPVNTVAISYVRTSYIEKTRSFNLHNDYSLVIFEQTAQGFFLMS